MRPSSRDSPCLFSRRQGWAWRASCGGGFEGHGCVKLSSIVLSGFRTCMLSLQAYSISLVRVAVWRRGGPSRPHSVRGGSAGKVEGGARGAGVLQPATLTPPEPRLGSFPIYTTSFLAKKSLRWEGVPAIIADRLRGCVNQAGISLGSSDIFISLVTGFVAAESVHGAARTSISASTTECWISSRRPSSK